MKIRDLTQKSLRYSLPLFLVTSPVIGEENLESTESMEVWGTRVESSSLSLEDDDLAKKQADHISDLLRSLPGVDVGGSHSLNQRITIRGMDDKDIKVSIDGARQNSYMYHHMGNLQIHADILKSAEIEVGSNSILNGSLGGAARFTTKSAGELLDPGSLFGTRFQSSVASNGGLGSSLTSYGKASESIDFLAYFNAYQRDDFRVGGGKIKDIRGNEIPETDGKVRGLKGDLQNYLIKSGWDISEDHRIEISYENYLDQGDYSYRPDMGLATDLAIANKLNVPLTYPTKFGRETAILKYTGGISSTSIDASIYDNRSNFLRDETGLESWRPPLATEKEGIANNRGANILASTPISLGLEQVLRYGAETNVYETEYLSNEKSQSSESSRQVAIYLENEIWLTEDASLTIGIREDQLQLDSTLAKKDYSQTSGSLKGEWKPGKFTLSASSTQLFKAPELGEVFVGAGLNDTPNPGIKAETGLNSELKVKYLTQAPLSGKVQLGVSVFQTDIDNYIHDGATKDNVGDMRIEGVESFVGYTNNSFQALASYSQADSKLTANEFYQELDGARGPSQQGDSYTLAFDYHFHNLDLLIHWDVMHVQGLSDGLVLGGATDNTKPEFTTHNLAGRWLGNSSFGAWDLTIGIDNVFDQYYASHSSQNGMTAHPLFEELYLMDYEPGRNVKATFGLKF